MKYGHAILVLVVVGCSAGEAPTSLADGGVSRDAAADARARRDATPPPEPDCVSRRSEARGEVSAPYAGLRSPLSPTTENVEAGRVLFANLCRSCHGSSGKGDGSEGGFAKPKPADLTASVYAEDYVFWRISEGGNGDPICSIMSSYKDELSETERWKLVLFVLQLAPRDGG